MPTRTIGHNATRQIAELKERLSVCKVYTLDNYFIGREIEPRHAWAAFDRGARLRDNGNGTCTISVHSNHWYELRTSEEGAGNGEHAPA